jgi:hypothetical protein
MEGTCEEDEYRKNSKTNFMLLAKRIKINSIYNKKMREKYEIITGHLA